MSLNRICYPGCTKDGHASEPLSRLCIHQKCENKEAICCICQFEIHKGHNTIPVKHFIQNINLSDSQQGLKSIEYAKNLDYIRQEFFTQTDRCRKNFLDQLESLETKAEIYFNRCEQALLQLSSLSNMGRILDSNQSSKSYQSYFKKILQLYSEEDKKGFNLKQKYEAFFEACKDKEKKINQNIEKINKQLQKAIKQSQQLLQDPLEVTPKISALAWSTTLKGAKIKIENNLAEQTGMESSGQRFGLIEQPLPQHYKTKWGIKVKKFVGWVGVGICLKNSIKAANFHFNYTNIGHGSYLISTNGYSWSHSNKDFNSAFKTFQFTVNDTVYIEYDPKESKLRFRKNNGAQKFELDVTPPPSGDSYHPCVNLCSTGDSVELVYPGQPLS